MKKCVVILLFSLLLFPQYTTVFASGTLNAVSFNMGCHTKPVPTLEDVAWAVEATGVQPDLILAQEIPWQVKHDQLAERLGFEHFISGLDVKPRSTKALFSRFELTDPFVIPTLNSPSDGKGGSGAGALCATMMVGDRKALVCTVHLETIREELKPGESLRNPGVLFKYFKEEFFGENLRSKSVDIILDRISRVDGENVVIGGDFNTFPFSKAVRKMGEVYDDALWPSFSFFKGSYKGSPLPIDPRVDFIFHSHNLDAHDAMVHEITSGDHVPISAVIEFGDN